VLRIGCVSWRGNGGRGGGGEGGGGKEGEDGRLEVGVLMVDSKGIGKQIEAD
jgi:hypothetical protein